MLHNTHLCQSKIEMKANYINTILKKGLKDCRELIKTTISFEMPLNETPSFSYPATSNRDHAFLASSTQDQDHIKKEILKTLAKKDGDSLLCALCLKTSSQETGFVILLACPQNRVYAVYQRPPVLRNNAYHFEEAIYLNEPQKSLPFLFNEAERYSH